MVVFTCNHCGESVKKASVEKHYGQGKCRNAPKSISCMDCQKDFQENYVEHTKCITEMQKYSGKDYVPRPSQDIGAKKQEGWVGVVHSILDDNQYKLSKETRNAFVILQNYHNIPQKKQKFLNFVTNSVRIQRRTVEDVWNILEKEQEKLKAMKAKKNNAKKEDKNEAVTETIENGVEVVGEEKALVKKNKKKNKKIINENENENENGVVVEYNFVNGNNEQENGKKKKRKQNKVETESVEISQINGHSEENKNQEKKNKVGTEITESSDAVEPPSKKQKKKEVETDTKESNDAVESPSKKQQKNNTDNCNVVSSKQTQSKKKKHKEMVENGNNTYEPNNKKQKTTTTNDTNEENSTETYFNWDEELARISSDYPEGLPIEKFKKKIYKKFTSKFADSELTERQEKGFQKKFNKKLTKSGILKLDGDLVKPSSS